MTTFNKHCLEQSGFFLKQLPRRTGGTESVWILDAGLFEILWWTQAIHKPFVHCDPTRLDRKWNWIQSYLGCRFIEWMIKVSSLRRFEDRELRCKVLVCRNSLGILIPVGILMLVNGYRYPIENRLRCSYVWFLAAAPEEALKKSGISDLKLFGPLIDTAIQESRASGNEGRLLLRALNEGPTEDRCLLYKKYIGKGFQDLSPYVEVSPARPNLGRYLFADKATASKIASDLDHLRY